MANNKIVATAVAACAIALFVAWMLDYAPLDEAWPTDEKGGTAETTKSSAPAPDLVAVGDIAEASGGSMADNRVAQMIERQHPDAVVAALGDLAYESGTLSEFDTYYHDV